MAERLIPKYLEPLGPYLWPGQPWDGTSLEGIDKGFLWSAHGRRGPVVFIVTVDHDGQVELSLVQHDPKKKANQKSKRCSESTMRTFCEILGFQPVEITKRPTTWHVVLVKGNPNYIR